MLLLRGAWLALIAGSADAAGWVLSGIFAAHITGNTVLLGVSLAQGDVGKAAVRAITVAGAFAGFSVAAALLRQDTPARRRATGLLASGLALLAALMGHKPYDIVLLAAALAAANFAYRNFVGTSVNIGFLTGDLQSLASALFGPKKDPTKTRVIPVVWVFYVAGGAATAFFAKGLAHPLLPAAVGLLAFVLSPFGGSKTGALPQTPPGSGDPGPA